MEKARIDLKKIKEIIKKIDKTGDDIRNFNYNNRRKTHCFSHEDIRLDKA